MINRLLGWLQKRYKRKIIKRFGGIPVLWAIYKPEQKPPNIHFYLHPVIGHDAYLSSTFTDIANHIRDEYGDVLKGDKDEQH